ncbi:MAG: hypothetical protein IKG57_01135 [Enterococcus sp.]|uniref:hypothetical protein n=1 Tax=Enterococcus sp. TaxID=35783 RepID=UPI00257A0ACB|nr:hypothetical protein [Enterococcus sp.]MBR3046780.1 hypothetical protein [Enterococcus sp.]
MPISKEKLKEMKKYNFHTISENDTEGKMCATCDYGTSLIGGTPAYCYKTGLRIDWDFICNEYKEKKDG